MPATNRIKDDSLPRPPIITAEVQAEADAEQRARAKFVSIVTNDNQRAFAIALKEIESYEEYHTLPQGEVENYATALSTVGRYKEAYKLTGNKFYQEIDKALKGKGHHCKCKDTTAIVLEKGQPVTKTFTRFFTKRKVYSIEEGTWKKLQCCNLCGRLTVE